MRHIDWWLVLPVVLLTSLGLLILRSAAAEVFWYQFSFLLIAVCFFIFASVIDYKITFAFYLWGYSISIFMLLLPIVFGIYTRGAVRWIDFGIISLQPSEVAKPMLLVFFAVIAHKIVKLKLFWQVFTWVAPAFLIFRQPDLGTTLVLTAGWVTLMISQFSLKKILVWGLLITLVIGSTGWLFLHGYQRERLQTFIDPYSDPLGKGYHVIQSVIAVGSGGFLGRGLGHGTQSSLRFLPEFHTDFMFATLAEELGFVGTAGVLGVYFCLLWRIYVLSKNVLAPVAKSYLYAVLGMLLFQIFVNSGMNMGIAPVTGITLPFLSYGGSSLVSWFITIGIVQSISSQNQAISL